MAGPDRAAPLTPGSKGKAGDIRFDSTGEQTGEVTMKIKKIVTGHPAAAACALATCLQLTGCGLKDLSERPPEGSSSATFPNDVSRISAAVSVPLDTVAALVDSQVPPSMQDQGHGQDICERPLGVKICVGTRYSYQATRGPISIAAGSPEALVLSMPISVQGQGGFRGTGADILKLDAKNFRAGALLNVKVTPRLGPDWCPTLDLEASYQWTQSPQVEIVSRAWIDVRPAVESALNAQLPSLLAQARSAIDCARFRADIEKVYRTASFPIALPWNDSLHVNVVPLDVHFSGLRVGQSAMGFTTILDVNAEVSGSAIDLRPLPLPPLKSIAAGEPPRLALAIPLRLPYASLTSAAQHLVKGKDFHADTPAGALAVKVNDIRAYPSGEKLVLAVDIDARLPGRFLNTRGTVFIAGTPSILDASRVAVRDVAVTRILDNDIWNVLSSLFDSQIRQKLEDAAVFDLGEDIAQAKALISAKLADPQTVPGLAVTATDLDIALTRSALAAKDLAIEARLGATVSLSPTPQAALKTAHRQ